MGDAAAGPEPAVLVIVGAGPTASSLLERIAANAALLDGAPLRVHLVDPFRAGTGRVWREDLDPRLWMNSMAEDVTLFVDDSVRCEGPHRPGPSLHEWASTIGPEVLDALDPVLADEIRALAPMSFPTRRVQSVYLDWFHRGVLDALPASIEVVAHRRRAIAVDELADEPADEPEAGAGRRPHRHRHRHRVTLEGVAEPLLADAVVLALGHLDADPDDAGARHGEFARRHGLVNVPPGHTGDLDLSVLAAGADTIVVGFGQAFTDLAVLVSEGRGGRFVEHEGRLRYEPSGEEPILHVGSRRGVPYRSKLAYRLQAPSAPFPRFLDRAAVERLLAAAPIDFRADVLPLVEQDVRWAAYHELFHAHPDRVTTSWPAFADELVAVDPHDAAAIADLVAGAIPDPADHVDLAAFDQPLRGVREDSAGALHRRVAAHVGADVARRTDPAFSADLGVFNALLATFGALGRLTPAMTTRSRVDDVGGWWFSFFMYAASGPPPARLRQLLALADAGLVHFAGGGLDVTHDEPAGTFVASSVNHPDLVTARTLVDARIATPSLGRTRDPLLAGLRDRGDAVEEVARDDRGWERNTGKVLVAGDDLRVVRADGSVHPRLHAIGTFTSRPAAGAFARPRTNAPAFRQNDVVARSLLIELRQAAARSASPVGEVIAS